MPKATRKNNAVKNDKSAISQKPATNTPVIKKPKVNIDEHYANLKDGERIKSEYAEAFKPKKTKDKKPVGRPSSYSLERAQKFCKEYITGKYITDICAEMEIPVSTLYDWLNENKEFSEMYARAKEISAELDDDEIKRIARDGSKDYGFKAGKDDDGETAFPFLIPENIQRSKLIVDTLKWSMSKRAPKKYGDKLAIGGDGDAPPIAVDTKLTVELVRAKG